MDYNIDKYHFWKPPCSIMAEVSAAIPHLNDYSMSALHNQCMDFTLAILDLCMDYTCIGHTILERKCMDSIIMIGTTCSSSIPCVTVWTYLDSGIPQYCVAWLRHQHHDWSSYNMDYTLLKFSVHVFHLTVMIYWYLGAELKWSWDVWVQHRTRTRALCTQGICTCQVVSSNVQWCVAGSCRYGSTMLLVCWSFRAMNKAFICW